MDLERYRDLFFQESREIVDGLNRCLLALEQAPRDEPALREAYRLVHTLKSMAATVGYRKTADLCHALETALDELLKGSQAAGSHLLDLLFKAADLLDRLIAPDAAEEDGPDDAVALADEIAHAARPGADRGPARPEATPDPEQAAPAPARPSMPTIRIRVDRLDRLINLAGELLIIKSQFRTLVAGRDADGLGETLDQLDRVAESLQREVLEARMRPIGFLFDRFSRTVRDLGRELDKRVDLQTSGHDIELDRVILDEISEPLVHLIRNAVDHGIEPPSVRLQLGKPPAGTLALAARREVDRVVIEVGDDGRGVNPEAVKRSAVRLGLTSSEQAEALSPQELTALLFLPGLSTAGVTTGVSGRGVGLNVVKTRVEALRGTIELESVPGQGTRAILRFPPTLAIVEALLVETRGQTFAVAMADVAEVLEVERSRISAGNVLLARGRAIQLVDLAAALDLGDGAPWSGHGFVLVTSAGGGVTGLVVDRVAGRQEIVIKPVGTLLQQAGSFSGATILGDGRVILILDVHALLRAVAGAPAPAWRA
jgi:two-component system chemotaxis sensor kinase CheA